MQDFDASEAGTVVLRVPGSAGMPGWRLFRRPALVLAAHSIEEVAPAIEEAERHAAAGGWAAGFVAYEAAPAFDAALRIQRPVEGLPLAWFGLYDRATPIEGPEAPAEPWSASDWRPSVGRGGFESRIGEIRNLIAEGTAYQVNYSIRLRADFCGDPYALFAALAAAQPTDHAAFVNAGRFAICSASPELFFERVGRRIVTKPMKGTAPRGGTPVEDVAIAARLASDAKNRAENLMIVDMARNDLGRIADVGSVKAESLFVVEAYETLFQMTSTVSAQSDAPLAEVFRAMFPAASITGAPKVRATAAIRDLECSPRGVYTGGIGVVAPGGDARFNVAIRTVLVDREQRHAVFGVGAGIVWDSTAEGEYQECLVKAKSLLECRGAARKNAASFDLFETFAWSAGEGFRHLGRHLARLEESARFFDRPFDREEILRALESAAAEQRAGRSRVRLTLRAGGTVAVEAVPLADDPSDRPVRLGVAETPVDPNDPFLRHKTTRREVYERARAECPDCDDAVLWNEDGFVTETTIANLVMLLDGEWVTPAAGCGLLPGVERAVQLEAGAIRERHIRLDDLARAQECGVLSSLRGWRRAELVGVPAKV